MERLGAMEEKGRGKVTVSDAVCNYESIKRRRESRRALGGTIDTLHICWGPQITVTPSPKGKKKDSLMTSNVTLQTAQQLSGLMVSRAVPKRCSSRPLNQKAAKCHASASCQGLATYTVLFI